MVEKIDKLLAEWKLNFETEEKQRVEMNTFLSKFENPQSSRQLFMPVEINTKPNEMLHLTRKQADLEAALTEKEEQILHYEQKIEIQTIEIKNCKFISKKRAKRKRGLYQNYRRGI